MKRINLYIISLIVFILTLPSFAADNDRGIALRPISPVGEEVSGDQWLFVIGINDYDNWPRLKTAVNDAKSVRDVLVSRYYFDKEHLIELYDDDANRKNILGSLRNLAKKVKENDSLVIFYAGHGHIDSITKTGSWIPVESKTEDVAAWISNNDIKNYLNVDAIKAKHILLISDSCFSGDFFRGQRGKLPETTNSVIKKSYALTSRQAITSGGLEPVTDAGFSGNSVFTHFLLSALRNNKKPFLLPSSIFPEITSGVAENAEQFPAFGSLRGTGGQQGGELVLFLKQNINDKDKLVDMFSVSSSDKSSDTGVEELMAEIEKMRKELDDVKKSQVDESAEKRANEIDELISRFKSEDEKIQEPAVEKLAYIGEPAVLPLIAALKDDNEDVREYSATALGEIGDDRALDPLIERLRDRDETQWTRGNSAEALGKIGDRRAVTVLEEALNEDELYIKISAALALADLKQTDWTQSEAAKAAVPKLIAALDNEDKWIRHDAAEVLGHIGDNRAVERLIEALGEHRNKIDDDIMWAIADALKKITGEDFGKYQDGWIRWYEEESYQ